MKLQSLTLFIFLSFIASASKIEKAYDALEIFDYFKAKQLFYKSIKKNTASASYGLATIYYRNDNPFYNIDSAAKYIMLSSKNLKDTTSYKSYKINKHSIKRLKENIVAKAYNRFCLSDNKDSLNHFLKTFFFADDTLLTYCYNKRDDIVYTKVLGLKNSEYIKEFMLQHPQSYLIPKATTDYYNIQYLEKTHTESELQYKYFITQYKSNPNIIKAEQKLFELVKEHHNTDSIYHFIKQYSSLQTKEDAWKLLFSKSTKGYDKNELTHFLKLYPEYPYKMDVLKSIELTTKILIPIKNNEQKFGYIDTLGNWVIKPLFDDASVFEEEIAVVRKDDKEFFINKNNEVLANQYFNEANAFSKGIAIVQTDSNSYLLNRSGQITSTAYAEINPLSDDLFVCQNSANKYGAIDKLGKTVIPFDYEKLGDFKNGFAYYFLNGKYGVLDKKNSRFKNTWDWVSAADENNCITVKQTNLFGIITTSDEIIIAPKYDYITNCGNHIYLLVKNNLYGFYNIKSKCFITDCEFDYDKALLPNYYTNGNLFKLLKNEEEAIANENGKFAINYGKYTEIGFFKYDVMKVKKNNKYIFLDSKFNPLFNDEYTEASDFKGNTAIVTKKNKNYLIDKNNKTVYSSITGTIHYLDNNLYLITENNLQGLLNQKGKILLPAEYTAIEKISNTLLRCEKNKQVYLYNISLNKLYLL